MMTTFGAPTPSFGAPPQRAPGVGQNMRAPRVGQPTVQAQGFDIPNASQMAPFPGVGAPGAGFGVAPGVGSPFNSGNAGAALGGVLRLAPTRQPLPTPPGGVRHQLYGNTHPAQAALIQQLLNAQVRRPQMQFAQQQLGANPNAQVDPRLWAQIARFVGRRNQPLMKPSEVGRGPNEVSIF